MKVVCIFDNPKAVPDGISRNFMYGLEIGKEYIVMGIQLFKGELSYLVDGLGRPGWFPVEIFKVLDSEIPYGWHFGLRTFPNEVKGAIWGFAELCNELDFYSRIFDNDPVAMDIYYHRKLEFSS